MLSKLVEFYSAYGFELRVTSTDRTVAKQDELYRQGKTKLPGGRSMHNFGRAADVVPGSPWPPVSRQASFDHIAKAGRIVGFEAVVEADHVHLERSVKVEQG